MKRFCCYGLALALPLAFAACSSGGDDDTATDGGTTDGQVIRLDGRAVDSSAADAGAPGMCNPGGRPVSTAAMAPGRVFATCAVDNDCQIGTQCIALASTRICLRCCDGSGSSPPATCEVGTSCTMQGLQGLSIPALENHCWFSFCGPRDGNGAGTLKSDCQVGADLWDNTAATFTPGWCLTFDDTGMRGSCTPIGNIARDATCTSSSAPGTAQCADDLLCVGNTTAGFKCRGVCDPRTANDTECATAGQDCQDSSEVNVGTSTLIGSYGFCIEGKRCNVLNDAMNLDVANPNNSGCADAPQRAFGGALGMLSTVCLPTTAARPNGICQFPRGTAALAATCVNNLQMTTAATSACGLGATCGAISDTTADATCLSWCGTPSLAGTAGAPCVAGTTTCKQYTYESAAGANAATIAIGYGVCAP